MWGDIFKHNLDLFSFISVWYIRDYGYAAAGSGIFPYLIMATAQAQATITHNVKLLRKRSILLFVSIIYTPCPKPPQPKSSTTSSPGP